MLLFLRPLAVFSYSWYDHLDNNGDHNDIKMSKNCLANQDQQITAVIVNRKENLLKKGGGYHLDLLIVAIGIIVNSLLGIPW